MKPDRKNRDRLEEAIEALRKETVAPEVLEQAAQRVWARIHQAPAPPVLETIRSCADFQALIPEWLGGRLPEARALLVEDHTRACPACRRALQAARGRGAAPAPRASENARWIAPRWAMAAGLVTVIGLAAWFGVNRFQAGGGRPAAVEFVEGALYRAGDHLERFEPGRDIAPGERVRTGPQSRAVLRLGDGSRIEMRERSELRMLSGRREVRLFLARGGIIVEAAKRRSGELYVVTEDLRVAVRGTIFAVSRGIKGSRVAVIEGQVRVEQAGRAHMLNPGEQYLSEASLAPADLRDEVCWSQRADSYVALLEQWATLRKKLEAVPEPPLNYSTRWLELAPEDLQLYASIPNFGATLTEVRQVFLRQLDESPLLRQWWHEQMKGKEAAFDEMLTHIRAFSQYLGPEVVVMLSAGAGGAAQTPVVATEIRRAGFREFLEAELKTLPKAPKIRIVEDPRALSPGATRELLVVVGRDWAAASTGAAGLRDLAARIERGSRGGFAQTALGARIAQAYRNGAGWLVAIDFRRLKTPAPPAGQAGLWAGLEDARYAILERKPGQGLPETRAQVLFAGPRRAALSWLAAPAPMGALDFISPEATLVAAFVVKEPARILDDLAADADLARQFAELEARTGLGLRRDLAAALGGEVVIALDGPLIPKPAWILLLEVADPAALQAGIERLLEAANRQRQGETASWRIAPETLGGRTFYSLHGSPAAELHYVFAEGYLVVAPSRAALQQALQNRQSGANLVRSARFTNLLPRDGQPDFSGLLFSNLGPLAAPLTGGLPLSAEQRRSLEAAGQPALVLFYGAADRIELAARGDLFGLGLESLMGLRRPPLRPEPTARR